jgi:hypothetical protein
LNFALGYAPGTGFALNQQGQSPDQGHSPIPLESVDGGAKPRLTSGGEAAALMSKIGFGKANFETIRKANFETLQKATLGSSKSI